MTTKKAVKAVVEPLVIKAPNFKTMTLNIQGTAPLVQNRFSKGKAKGILDTQIAGSTAKGKKNIKARDILQDFADATHLGEDGLYGIPASAFRSAMISACRLVGFQMTKAKLTVFIEADSFDADDGCPLVHIADNQEPELHQGAARLPNGSTTIAIRPMWRRWAAAVRVKWDADQFTQKDVINLMMRAGVQVGIGEGRPDSRKSNGMGWGTFEIINT